jgi:putative peptide zinc metalloprotease protein
MRFESDLRHEAPAEIEQETPAAQRSLPSAALGLRGGGEIMADPTDPSGRAALEKAFLIDVAPLEAPTLMPIGGRAYVRFEHRPEPLLNRLLRRFRQVFLKYLDV